MLCNLPRAGVNYFLSMLGWSNEMILFISGRSALPRVISNSCCCPPNPAPHPKSIEILGSLGLLNQALPAPWRQATLWDVHGLFIQHLIQQVFINIQKTNISSSTYPWSVDKIPCIQWSHWYCRLKGGECSYSARHWLNGPRMGKTSAILCTCLQSGREREWRHPMIPKTSKWEWHENISLLWFVLDQSPVLRTAPHPSTELGSLPVPNAR